MWMRSSSVVKLSSGSSELPLSRILTSIYSQATLATNAQPNVQENVYKLRVAKPFDRVPGAKTVPFLGTAWQCLPPFNKRFDMRKFYDLTLYQCKKYGTIWREVIPFKGVIVHVTTVEDVKEVLRLDGKFPAQSLMGSLTKYRKERIEMFSTPGLMCTNGEEWWQMRSKAQQPMLKPQNTFLYLPIMADVADQMVARIRKIRNEQNQVPDDFRTEMYKWALESVSLVALDTRLGCLDENAPQDSEPRQMIQATVDTLHAMFALEMGAQLYKIFPSKHWRKLVRAQDCFTKVSLKYIERAAERINAKSADDNGQLTMLEAMLTRGMSAKEAITMTIDLMMAGTETTSTAMSFLLYLLARNTDKQELLRQEIDRVLPSKTSAIDPHHFTELRYLKACVKESLRLMPPGPGFTRNLQQDAVLSGYHIPKGTMILCHQQLMARMEEHFPNPDAFIPERWIKGHPLASNASPYTVLPFGVGPRACIGRRLAEQEMYSLTVKILQNFRIEYNHPDLGIEMRFGHVPDKPLRFTFADR